MSLTQNKKKLSLMGVLVSFGIVYGDIGTSPLYTMNAIIRDGGGFKNLQPDYIIGSISLIIWTLMIITTLKYVIIAMQASNHGEGGIFALYTLVRRKKKWLIVPALIGGAALLADGTITPAVTVTSAIEGLKSQNLGLFTFSSDQNVVIAVVIAILLVVFAMQRFGTAKIGQAFGPIMCGWFFFIAIVGFCNLLSYPGILKALSPVYGLQVLFSPANKSGFFILGSIFLATTGAEALYSDMGHVGKHNIYFSWPIVYLSLVLSYMGQGAWLINNHMTVQSSALNPFYAVVPDSLTFFAIILATLAAVIASQALITGSYTLVSEAIRLKILPRMIIHHPGNKRGQIYIGTVNWLLCIITIALVLYFQNSQHMEAAYGLAITVTMLMTTILLHNFLDLKVPKWLSWVLTAFFLVVEFSFFISSAVKFEHGGYVTVLITLAIILVMYIWYFGNKVRSKYETDYEYGCLTDYKDQLVSLSRDEQYPVSSTNLVYMAKVKKGHQIKKSILYSILDKRPKRAKVYWFITMVTTDSPYTHDYTVETYGTKNVVQVTIYLGFKKSQKVNVYLRQIINDLIDQGTIDPQPQRYTTSKGRRVGDFKFVILKEALSLATNISGFDRWLVSARIWLQNHTATPIQWFGLSFSDVRIENVPVNLGYKPHIKLRRINHKKARQYETFEEERQ
ncbi:KUP/HAK/KT family potassium transporter [Holzapfeliella sp. JNUCC 80]